MLLLVLVVYVVVPQLGSFRSSWHVLSHVTPFWVVLAIAFTAFTFAAAAATYRLLALRPLRYGQLLLVQLAAMFMNRLLPAGIGAVGINYAYLRRARHSVTQSATVVALNNLLGVVGHGLLVLLVLVSFSGQLALLPRQRLLARVLFAVATGVVLIVVAVLVGRTGFRRRLLDIRRQILSYRTRPGHVLAALLTSMALTLCNIFCLGACALALGVHVPFVALVLVFTFGVGAGAATPTPGGLGGFEAGLLAGFVTYHVPTATALAVALLYRLISYWLPLAAGAVAFAVSQRRQLITG